MSQIKSGALLSYLSIFLGSTVSLFYTPIMLRMMGQSEYGLMSLANSVVGYLGLLNLGLGSAMVRYISKFKAQGNIEMMNAVLTLFLKVFGSIAIIVLAAGIVLAFNVHGIFSNTLSDYEFRRLQILMVIISFNIGVGMVSGVFYSLIYSYERFVFSKLVGIINTIITPLIMLPLLYMGYRSVGIMVASTILNLVNVCVSIFYSIHISHFTLRNKSFERAFLKELFGFSFYVFMAMIVDKVYWGTDQFILGAVSGTVAVAIYNVGSTFTTYFMSFSTAITGLFLPKLTQMDVQKVSDEEFTELFIKVGRIQFLILMLILGGFILVGYDFVRLWAGEDYRDAFWIGLVIIVPFVVPLIQNLGLQMMYARNLHKFRSIVLFIIAIFNVLISIPAAKLYGGFGAAAVTAASFVIGQIIILNWFYKKRMGIDIWRFWRNIGQMFVAFIICVSISFVAYNYFTRHNWLSVVTGSLSFFAIYGMFMWHFSMNTFEKTTFLSVLHIKK